MEPQQVFGKRRAEVVGVVVEHRRLVLLVPEVPEGLPVWEDRYRGHAHSMVPPSAVVIAAARWPSTIAGSGVNMPQACPRPSHRMSLPSGATARPNHESDGWPHDQATKRYRRDESVDEDRGSVHFSPSRSIVQMSPSRWFCS